MNTSELASDEIHQLRRDLDETRARLTESKEVLDAICNGKVDGILTTRQEGRQVFLLNGEQEPYQHIIEQMHEGALTLSREGIILYANPTMALLLQTPIEHVIGAEIRNFVDPADSSVLASLIAESGGGKCQGELHLRVPDGSSLAVRLGLSLQQSDSPTKISVVVTDLTAEKKKTELLRLHTELEKRVAERTADLVASRLAALNMMDDAVAARQKAVADHHDLQQEMTERKRAEESLIRLSTAVEQSAETIVITDAGGTILYVNPSFERISGYTREEVIGQTPRILKSGKLDPGFYQQMWAELIAGKVWTGKITNKHKNGTFYEVMGTISPVRDATGTIVNYVAVRRDVTHETQLEAQLLQAQKMEIVGNLAGGIAHDFNNILTAVMANLDLIGAEGHVDGPAREYLSEARSELDRAATLTSHLLAFSRQQIIRPVRADLNHVIANIKCMLLRVLGEHIILDIRPADEPVLVLADVAQMEQVLMNLCVNARDAMPSGGTLTIAVRSLELKERYDNITQSEVPVGRYAYLEITDTGTGMDTRTLSRIFEPFFTTKEQGKGTGLGLAMVYGIIKQHRGHIFVYSEPGHGTTFKLYLPWMTSEAQEVESAEVAIADVAVHGGTETILVAEDEAAVARGVTRTLQRLGYKVISVIDGQHAVATIEKETARIDLVMLDAVMPNMGGKEAATRITALKPSQKFLFTSGFPASKEVADEAFILPPDVHFIQKPYAAADLARAVRKALDE